MKKLVGISLLLVAVFLIVLDVYVIGKGGTAASISQMVMEWSYKYPLFTFACGILCGHFFWRIRDTKESKQISDDTRK